MNNSNNLPDKIRQMRLAKGFSQENMADMLGISTTAYGDLERGRTDFTFTKLEAIAKTLDVSFTELLGLEVVTLSETEWLRQENERLSKENARLLADIEQWKSRFKQLIGRELIYEIGQDRGRIGF